MKKHRLRAAIPKKIIMEVLRKHREKVFLINLSYEFREIPLHP